ncbi:hypothetical protein C1H46_031069 [Malus baccata]|uniref:Uncharacterized protein n=1 Tax=Malus baccata TaxID=106549 RepID=A0A540LAJ5_MALBA|nr:hypothetical protein C1H46_031069 [Malus baccata]
MGFLKEEKSKRVLRGVKTVFFLITMLISLLLFSAPILLVIADTLLPSAILSASSSSSLISLEALSSHFNNYDFRSSLVDIPLISIIRSAVIFCVYSFCDGPRLSHGPYLGITTMCSVLSLVFVSLKASYVFGASGVERAEYVRATDIALFICSLALAVGHIVVAYRTSCRERRKLWVYKIDIEAVLQPDVKLDFAVHKISINRNGSALLLSGSSNLCVMYLYGWTSNKDNATICSTLWFGLPPPLLRLAIVDLTLPRKAKSGSLIRMFTDPLMLERIYTLHDGGLDSIVLHYLPFTSQISGKNQTMRTPSVHPVLSTCQGKTPRNLRYQVLCIIRFICLFMDCGTRCFARMYSAGDEAWNLLLPLQVDMENKFLCLEEPKEKDMPNLISKELLVGPKVVLLPQSSPSLRSLSADSIEGRPKLHKYFRSFHEYYAEYNTHTNDVYFELEYHGPILKRIIDDQHARLGAAQQRLSQVEEKQSKLEDRIDSAIQMHNLLEERLKHHISGVELDELDELRSSINTVTARLRRHTQSPKSNASNQRRPIARRKDPVQESQVSHLKFSVEKLTGQLKIRKRLGLLNLNLKVGKPVDAETYFCF